MSAFHRENTGNPSDQFVTIELFGQPYTFKTEAEAPRAKEVADFLVNEINKVEDRLSDTCSNLTKQAILIVTALNIASENFALKKQHSNFLHQVSVKTTKLIHLLNMGR